MWICCRISIVLAAREEISLLLGPNRRSSVKLSSQPRANDLPSFNMAKDKSDKKDKKKKETKEVSETVEESIVVGEDVDMEDVEVAKVSRASCGSVVHPHSDGQVEKKVKKEKEEIVIPLEDLSPIAHPLAQKKLLKKLHKTIKKGTKPFMLAEHQS